MKTFLSLATIAFAFIPLVPFVTALDLEASQAVDHLLKTCPYYLIAGILGMLGMMWLEENFATN